MWEELESEIRLRGVVGGKGAGVSESSEEEVCSDGISLLVLLLALCSDLRRSRKVAASSPEEEDNGGEGAGGTAG